MAVSSFPYGANTGPTTVAPTVSALADGDVNTSSISTRYVGVKFDTDGEEYELTGGSSTAFGATVGTWLDTGTSDQVWVLFTRTAGATQFSNRASNTRFNIASDVTFYGLDSNPNSTQFTITGTFSFYDAASGGNLLQTTASAVWRASYFDSCPLCCFTPDTLVSMARGIQVPIGSVRVGDMILTVDGSEEVTEVITRTNRPMVRITFSDGRFVDASEDHPFDVKGEPKSLNHFGTEYKDLGLPAQLRIGDQVTTDVGTVTIRKIERLEYPDTVYTFANSKFFANGMLVY